MTVKCLNDEQKCVIKQRFLEGNTDTSTIAKQFICSRRTIERVLVEQGVLIPRKRKAPVKQNTPLPELTFMEKVRCFFKVAFRPKATKADATNNK